MLGMTGSIMKFFPYFKNEPNKHHDFFTLTLLMLSFGLIIVLSFYIAMDDFIIEKYSKDNSMFKDHYILLLLLFVFESLFQLFTNIARANGAVTLNSFLREVVLRLLTSGSIGLYYFGAVDYAQFISLFVYQYLAIAVLQLFQLHMMGHIGYGLRFMSIAKDMRISLFRYSVLTLITAMGTMMLLNIDTLLVGAILGLGYSAYFSIGYYLTSLITIPNVSMMSILLPMISESWKNGKIEKLNALYTKSSLNQMILGGLLFLLLILNVNDVVSILPSEYSNVREVIVLVSIAKYVDMSFGVNGAILFTSPKYQYETIINIIAIVFNTVGSYFMIQQFGLIGAGVMVIFVGLLLNGLRYSVLRWKFNMNPFNRSSLYSLILVVGVFCIVYMIPMNNSWLVNLILRSFIIVTIYVPVVLWLRLSEDINAFAGRVIGKSI
jgi:O-antigen/teichoic acid export membrane protein